MTYQHRQQRSRGLNIDFLESPGSLTDTVAQRIELLYQTYTPSMIHTDPLLLFTGMMAYGVTLKLGQMAELASWDPEQWQHGIGESKQKTPEAALKMVELSSSLSKLSSLKVSVFQLFIIIELDSQ